MNKTKWYNGQFSSFIRTNIKQDQKKTTCFLILFMHTHTQINYDHQHQKKKHHPLWKSILSLSISDYLVFHVLINDGALCMWRTISFQQIFHTKIKSNQTHRPTDRPTNQPNDQMLNIGRWLETIMMMMFMNGFNFFCFVFVLFCYSSPYSLTHTVRKKNDAEHHDHHHSRCWMNEWTRNMITIFFYSFHFISNHQQTL